MASNYEKVKEWRSRPQNKNKRAEEARRWRAKHPELYREIVARYRATAKARKVAAMAAAKRKKKDPEGDLRRRKAFEARKEQKLVQIAGRPRPGTCELCSEFHLRIVFDHCHQHGHFRGWLCDRCNKVLGMVKDSPSLLSAMCSYLLKSAPHEERSKLG